VEGLVSLVDGWRRSSTGPPPAGSRSHVFDVAPYCPIVFSFRVAQAATVAVDVAYRKY
jgi:hypothetical protein